MTTRPRRRIKVMVVDDDEIVLEVTRDRLETAGYEVTVRSSALGTTGAIMRERPDFVLLDVAMPGLPGDELARLLGERDLRPRPKIILHSGSSRSKLVELADQCGAVGVIEKTSNERLFINQVADCIASFVV